MLQERVEVCPVHSTNKVMRRHSRGFYDHATLYALLDAATVCHVIHGPSYCTPTLFKREGSRLHWQGSSASRMLRNPAEGAPACMAVTHLDGLVLARCGFNHSVVYHSVMAFGRARLVTDLSERERALVMMVRRFFPGWTAGLRQSTRPEIKATAVVFLDIARASAKIRAKGVAVDEEDYALPIYAERLPERTVIGTPEPCPRILPGGARPDSLEKYRPGHSLEADLDKRTRSPTALPRRANEGSPMRRPRPSRPAQAKERSPSPARLSGRWERCCPGGRRQAGGGRLLHLTLRARSGVGASLTVPAPR